MSEDRKSQPEATTCQPLPSTDVTAERLRELVLYDANTGDFVWRVGGRRRVKGGSAGYVRPNGYMTIGVDGKSYQAHRLAWLYMTGEWPADQIDHIDRDRSNNRWSNLRDATNSQNAHNRWARKRNACGLRGVHLNETGKWTAQIKVSGRSIYLGQFASPEEAHEAYLEEAARVFGAFASAA